MHQLGGRNLKEARLAKAMTWVKCPSRSESEESEQLRTVPRFRGGHPVRKMATECEQVVMLNTFITSGRSSVPHDFNTFTTWETPR